MLSLETPLRIPSHVTFSIVGTDAFLLNTQTNKYYGLEEVGARFWNLLTEGKLPSQILNTLLGEYQVTQEELKTDLLELMEKLHENGLIEISDP